MNVKCPYCGKKTSIAGNPFRPFCSERCKLIDLGRWLSSGYRIPAKDEDENDDGKSFTPGDPVQE